MSGDFVEGGAFKCHIHPTEDGKPIEFSTRAEFDEHCGSTGHTIEGTAPCMYCKTIVEFKGLPYQSAGVAVPAVCPACTDKYVKPALEASGYAVSKTETAAPEQGGAQQ